MAPLAAARELSLEADGKLRSLAAIAEAQTRLGWGEAPGRWCVLGLGKFGGQEMRLGSDLDLVFVYSPAPGADEAEAGVWFCGLARELTRLLTAAPDWRDAHDVDFRLRPHGEDGPLATPVSGLTHYLRTEVETWELMALTRLRYVAGCVLLAREVAAEARAAMIRARAVVFTEARAMRCLMEQEQGPAQTWDVKRRPGGLIDIEFIVQALQIESLAGGAPVLKANTGEAIAALAQAGILKPREAGLLAEAWRFCSSIRQLQAALALSDLSRAAPEHREAVRTGVGHVGAPLTQRLGRLSLRVRAELEARLGRVENAA